MIEMITKMVSTSGKSLILAAVLASGVAAQAADFEVDPVHSKVGFAVRHMMITDVTGNFKDFKGTFSYDEKKDLLTAGELVVQTKSINTDNEKRDEHLRSADFFDAEKHPTLSVTNSKITRTGKGKYTWKGDLNMHGATVPATFIVTSNGKVKDAWGANRIGFVATTTVNRSKFGLNWNKALEAGGVAVSDEVRIKLDISAVEAKPAAPPAATTASAPAAPAEAPSKKK